MKSFDEILEEQFKKLYPYKPLMATEKAAIILTNIEWLNQFTEFDSMEEAVYVTSFVGRLQKELQNISKQEEGKTQ